MDFEMAISAVFFVESLRNGDLRTGREVHEHIRPLLISRELFWEPQVRSVSTRTELMKTFREIEFATRSHRLHPAIQIDAHGSDEGLQLSDGDNVAWSDLADPIRRINGASENNTLLCSAMCSGANLARIALSQSAFLPTPYWAMLGPARSLSAGDLQSACQGFWENVLADSDMAKALATFQERAGPASVLQCEMLFARIWMNYVIDAVGNPDGLDQRVERIFMECKGAWPRDRIRSMVASIEDLERTFREMRDLFLWVNKYPANRGRYSMTFAEACKLYPNG